MIKIWFGFILASSLAISGCASKPPLITNNQFSEADVIEVVFPSTDPKGQKVQSGKGALTSLQGLGYNSRSGAQNEYINSLRWNYVGEGFELIRNVCLNSQGKCSRFDEVKITVTGDLALKEKGEHASLLVIPKQSERFVTRNMITGKPEYKGVKYDFVDLKKTISKTTYPLTFEVDSPYSPESIYANFQRLSRKEAYSRGAQKDPVSGKIFKERFWLKTGAGEISLNLETYPYRNGSKAVIYAQVKPELQGNKIDFAKSIEALEERVKTIVNM